MPRINAPDTEFYLLIVIVSAIILFVIIIRLMSFLNNFMRELRYLNAEIERSDGNERLHYIRRKRCLWLSLIPFVKYK